MTQNPDQTQARTQATATGEIVGMPGAPQYREPLVERLPLQLSLGAWLIVVIAVLSSIAVYFWPERSTDGLDVWLFARVHEEIYLETAARYAEEYPDAEPFNIVLLDGMALQRRMLSGFTAGTPVADLIEIEQGIIGRVFSGPLEDVGLTDLTDRLKADGLYEQINEPSFSQWSTRGRIFCIPHDVHPVVLMYRHDILVEQLGYDMEAIETWDEFADVLRVAQDINGDGAADRYLLNIWHTAVDVQETLLMQAGGGLFDADDRLVLNSELNAYVMAKLITWMVGPDRIAIDAAEFSAPGNELRLSGQVLSSIAPDWLCGVYQQDLPQLAGKWRVMPLPAWEKGGSRTSVRGGSAIGISKQSEDFEAAYNVAKFLYIDPQSAQRLYENNFIISPVKTLWDEPFYHEPADYFGGQKIGSLFIELAPQVPRRSSSPFRNIARAEWGNAMSRLFRYANDNQVYTIEEVQPVAQRLLDEAQAEVRKQMDRQVFLREQPPEDVTP